MGFIAARLKLPVLVGYLIAGIIIGPATPGFVADVELSTQLAEIGVMLLMFGIGLHFSLDDLLAVRRISLPGALVQITVATLLGIAVAALWGWSLAAGLVFGLALSVASTVVLLRTLESRGLLETVNGRIAVGWLVVEDLVMVLVLVLLPPLALWLGGNPNAVPEGAENRSLLTTLVLTFGQVSVFIALMLVVGKRLFPWLLWQIARTGSQELFTLCVIAAAVGIAYGSAELFGVSFALGAFFAGMVMRESPLSYRAAEESLPLRDAFSVLFFVSVGMLFDPGVLTRQPLQVITVVLNRLTGHLVLAGYGRVGRRIGEALTEKGIPFVVAEENREIVEKLRESGIPAVSGDASEPAVLIQGHVARARMLVIATPDTLDVRRMIEIARTLNPRIETVVRTHSEEEAVLLEKENAGKVFMGEHELAVGMIRHVIERFTAAPNSTNK